jgi:NAD(P)-dependent dehydrogenase (short-subunit alcohol dehydrogenase family)
MGKLTGRVALITGASRGLGNAIARELWCQGASLALTSQTDAVHDAREDIVADMPRPDQLACSWDFDVNDDFTWPHVTEGVIQVLGGLDIAVCNAGVYGPIGRTEDVPWDAWVAAIETNLLGTVLTCRAVVPQMRKQGHGKIIVISGGGATRPLPRFSAYAASKAAVVRFAETLAEELRGSGIDVNSVSPGALNTRMLDEVLLAGPEKTGSSFYAKAAEQKEKGGTPLSVAAELVAFLASPACDGISGRLISAVWDNWRELPAEHLRATSDRYTLRRIE